MTVQKTDVSVVIPCHNEEATIGVCVEKAKKVFSEDRINGEIIVVDNGSTDKSAEIAGKAGAKVIAENRRGYGAAYIRGLKEAQGDYIIMGDGDNTYDFYDINKFIQYLKNGYDFVIGSRFKGKIRKGAMPFLNRYLGNPILSGMCRLFFRTSLSDIHCGMRGFTKEAYKKMNLKCLGMEFATEMVAEALQRHLRIKEVPIEYYARAGESKLRPVKDAWRHVRFMLLFCPTWLYFVPGLFFTIFGLSILLLLVKGPFLFLGHKWDMHMIVLSSLLSILGYQVINIGIFAKTFAAGRGYINYDATTLAVNRYFRLETGILVGLAVFIAGLGINISIFIEWWQKSFGPLHRIREAILAMTFIVIGLQTIFSSFFISLLLIKDDFSN